jgi:hypothetical protein
MRAFKLLDRTRRSPALEVRLDVPFGNKPGEGPDRLAFEDSHIEPEAQSIQCLQSRGLGSSLERPLARCFGTVCRLTR